MLNELPKVGNGNGKVKPRRALGPSQSLEAREAATFICSYLSTAFSSEQKALLGPRK